MMTTNIDIEQVAEASSANGVCFCRVCKGLFFCYLACLAIPLLILTGVLAIVFAAFLG